MNNYAGTPRKSATPSIFILGVPAMDPMSVRDCWNVIAFCTEKSRSG